MKSGRLSRLLWLVAGLVVAAVGAIAWLWFTYFMYARGSYCPGDEMDPLFACFPTFEQAPGASVIQYGGAIGILGLALFIFDLAGQGWKARRSRSIAEQSL